MVPTETAVEPKAPARSSTGHLADLERRLGEMSAEVAAERARFAQLEQAAARNERHRIAQVLHDTVCQSLSGVSLEAAVLTQKLEELGVDGTADGKVLREMVRHAVREVHDLVDVLRQESGDHAASDLHSLAKPQNEMTRLCR